MADHIILFHENNGNNLNSLNNENNVNDENRELDATAKNLLRQVSGQIRGSLGNIFYALERLAPPDARETDEKTDLNAAILLQSACRVLRLSNNLEYASNLDNPGSSGLVRLTNQDIIGLCRETAEKAMEPARLLGLDFEFRCNKRGHIIQMDDTLIERMIMNLLDNAFKFTPRGGKVTFEVHVKPDFVELSIADTGCGITDEQMETVFERYLHPELVDPPPHGLGLGLPISRHIAREHGGGLLLASPEGKGTTVKVSLPNRKAAGNQVKFSAKLIEYGGFNRTLVELADALPKEAFKQIYVD